MDELPDYWSGGEAARHRCDRMLAMGFTPPPYWIWVFDTTESTDFRTIGEAIRPHLQADPDVAAYSLPLGAVGHRARTAIEPIFPLQQISELAGRCVVVVTENAEWPGVARLGKAIPTWTTTKVANKAPIAAAFTVATAHRLLAELGVEFDVRIGIDSLVEHFEQVAESDDIRLGVDLGSLIAQEALEGELPDDVPSALRAKVIELAREWTTAQF